MIIFSYPRLVLFKLHDGLPNISASACMMRNVNKECIRIFIMLNRNIKVSRSHIAGRGLFASRAIVKGEVVWTGPTKEQTFTLKEISSWPKRKQRKFFEYAYQTKVNAFTGPEDGTPHDPSLFMNHSCDPNTWFDGDNILKARRDIAEGDEITYDYETSETIFFRHLSMRCRCGSKNCRRWLSGKALSDKRFHLVYSGHVLTHVQSLWDRAEKDKRMSPVGSN